MVFRLDQAMAAAAFRVAARSVVTGSILVLALVRAVHVLVSPAVNQFVQRPKFDVADPGWRPPNLADLPDWRDAKRVAIDTETCDPQLRQLGPGVRRDGYVVGISFAIEDGPAFYLPIRHESGDNLDPVNVWRYLKDQAADFTGTIVGMNLPYDLDYLAENGVVFRRAAWFRDVSVAAVLINELHNRYSLDDILQRAGLAGKDEGGLRRAAEAWGLDPKAELWKLPARHVGPYAIGDVTLPLQLLRRQERDIEAQELERVWDLESRVLPITVKLRRRGVRIDLDRLEQVRGWAHGREVELLGRVKHATGVEIRPEDIHKKKLVAQAIEHTGVKLPETPTGQPKMDRATLESIDHDVARWILRTRKYNKMRTTFAASMLRHLVNGRIHATFRQIKGGVDGQDDEKGVAFGRFSSTDPNLQQQYNPKKEPEISGMWRQIFLPEEGARWAAADFSSQEPRMAVHFACAAKCDGAEALAAKYRADPNFDLHQQTAELCRSAFDALGIPRENHRSQAKIIFLGIAYGMGGAKLCRSLGLPTTWWTPRGEERAIEVAGDEGRQLLSGYDEMVPFMRQLSKKAIRRAERVGYVRTLSGRRCRFWQARDGSYDRAYKALNRIIQGSSADQGKQALVDADAAGFYVQIPVHDELDASVADRPEAERLAKVMEETVSLSVPFVVDVEIGPNWGEAK